MDQFKPAEPETVSGMARVRDTANAQLVWRKDRATDGLVTVAQAARQTTQRLREQHHDHLAKYVDKAADHLERFSTRLKEKDISELVGDVRRFARRRPAIFIGSAFAVGFVCSRLMRRSSSDDLSMESGTTEHTGHEWTERNR